MFKKNSLRRADLSSRGFVPSVVLLCVKPPKFGVTGQTTDFNAIVKKSLLEITYTEYRRLSLCLIRWIAVSNIHNSFSMALDKT